MNAVVKIGAAVGAAAFVFFGLIPGFFLGSYGSLLLLRNLTGGPLEPTVFVRLVMAVGILLGIMGIGSACVLAGAISGAAVDYGRRLVMSGSRTKATVGQPFSQSSASQDKG